MKVKNFFLHIESIICYIYYGANIKTKQLISLIERCKILFRVFSCSTPPCKDADPSSVEKSIDEMQEIGKLKVIASWSVSNDIWRWYNYLLVHKTTLKLGPSNQTKGVMTSWRISHQPRQPRCQAPSSRERESLRSSQMNQESWIFPRLSQVSCFSGLGADDVFWLA